VSDLLNMNIMVMSQKPKFIEMTNEYEITYENGTAVFRAPIPRAALVHHPRGRDSVDLPHFIGGVNDLTAARTRVAYRRSCHEHASICAR
jgi:hypothetical protein